MKFAVIGRKITPTLFTGCIDGVVCSLPTDSPSIAIARGHELRGLILEQEIKNGND